MAFARSSVAAALALMGTCLARAQEYVISTYAGGAPQATPVLGVDASVGPTSVATDAVGNVYFASDNCVFKLDTKGVLTRVAGNSRRGYSGDGGPAASAQFDEPSSIAVDGAGNLYIVDSNKRVRKVSPAGIITTVAGNGTRGFSGDGGRATSAQLASPSGLAVDGAGNLYISDLSSRVRKVSAAGIITTVAGNGRDGYSGDGGPATSAQLSGPGGIAVDGAGNLYIADGLRVRKVSPAGIISTVAGDGSPSRTLELDRAGDGGPATSAQVAARGVAADGAGNLYIAVVFGVRKVSPAGIITTVAGNGTPGYSGDGGPAISAQVIAAGIAVDGAGNLYIVNPNVNAIRRVSAAGIITTVAGNGTLSYYSGDGGPATGAQLLGPAGVTLDDAGNLFIADQNNNRVRRVSPAGIIATVAGDGTQGYSGDGGPAVSAQLASPTGLAVDGAGNLYISDLSSRVRKVSAAGIITTVAGNGGYGYSGDGGPATRARLNRPPGVAVDGGGNLYVLDAENYRVRKVSPAGIISTVAGSGTHGSSGDGGPAVSAQLAGPTGLAVDAAGNLYIADGGRVRKVSPAGIITTVAGGGSSIPGDGGPATSAQLNSPWRVAVDSAGNLYIADSGNAVVRKVSPAGIITTVAGNGTLGYSGDGGPATSAQLDPGGVVVDGTGRVFVADPLNNAIRLLTPVAPAPAR